MKHQSTPLLKWNGYTQITVNVKARSGLLVIPQVPAQGSPWIWRTEFFNARPAVDLALLSRGFHLAYVDVQNMYGSPAALDIMDAFYEFLTKEYSLCPKTALEGFSRGGLFAYNWAARNPQKTAVIYADAPVCDFKSWPGGFGLSPGSKPDWDKCLKVYGLTQEQALKWQKNPVDNLVPLADAGISLIHVCGLRDEIVPFNENTGVLAERYRSLGGFITVITKPFCGHHPHSLENPSRVVDFILHACGQNVHSCEDVDKNTPYGYCYHVLRGNLNTCRRKFMNEKKGRVCFLGGSITFNPGWRTQVCDFLTSRFPDTCFEFLITGFLRLIQQHMLFV